MRKKNQRARQRDQRRQAKAAKARRRSAAASAQGRAQSGETSRKPPSDPLTQMTTRFTEGGFNITSTPIAEEDIGTMHSYMNAHSLLPGDYHLGGPLAQALEKEAFAVLADETAPDVALLRSIVILGHTPTATALQALHEHVTSGRRLAGVAKMAADECADWMTEATGVGQTASMAN